jgi:hypothetical protein
MLRFLAQMDQPDCLVLDLFGTELAPGRVELHILLCENASELPAQALQLGLVGRSPSLAIIHIAAH